MPRIMLNVESVGLSPEQFFRLCRDNPEMRIELTAQKEIPIMSPTNMKTGMLNATLPNGAKRSRTLIAQRYFEGTSRQNGGVHGERYGAWLPDLSAQPSSLDLPSKT
jgi:hypothetical protein